MKKRKPCLTIILCLIMIFSLIGIPINAYASQWRLSTTNVSLQPKEKCTLFIDNGKKTLSNKKTHSEQTFCKSNLWRTYRTPRLLL